MTTRYQARPTAQLTSPAGARGSNGKHADMRRTTCKLCPYSVLIGESAVWLTSPPGLSHADCVRRTGLTP